MARDAKTAEELRRAKEEITPNDYFRPGAYAAAQASLDAQIAETETLDGPQPGEDPTDAFIRMMQAEGYSDDEIVAELRKSAPAPAPVTAGPRLGADRINPEGSMQGALGRMAELAPQMPQQFGEWVTRKIGETGQRFHDYLPASVDPTAYVALGMDASTSIATAATEGLLNPKRMIKWLLDPSGSEWEPSERTKTVLNFVRPEALLDMVLMAPARMVNSFGVSINPLLTETERYGGAEALYGELRGMVPIDQVRLVQETYGAHGAEGVVDSLIEHPETALGVVAPLMLVAAGAAAKGGKPVRLDTPIADLWKSKQRLDEKAAFARLRSMVDERVPDSAVGAVVDLLVKDGPDGIRPRTLDEGLRELRSPLLPEELAKADHAARLQLLMERTMKAHPPQPLISTEAGHVAIAPEILSILRHESKGIGEGPFLEHPTALGRIMDQEAPQPGRVERVAMLGRGGAPDLAPFKPGRERAAKPLEPRTLAPRAALESLAKSVEGVVMPVEEAQAVAAAVRQAKPEATERLARALELARQVDPTGGLTRVQLRRVAEAAQKPIAKADRPKTLAQTVAEADPDIPEDILPSMDPTDVSAAMRMSGADFEQIDRALAAARGGVSPFFAEGQAAAPGKVTSLGVLREAAAKKGWQIRVEADNYVLGRPGAPPVASVPIRNPEGLGALARTIERWEPAPPPTEPPVGPIGMTSLRPSRHEAGFIDLGLATGGLGPALEKAWSLPAAAKRTAVRAALRADDLVSRFEFGFLPPTAMAKEFGPKGFELVGSLIRGQEETIARTAEALNIVDAPLRRRGVRKGYSDKRNLDMGLILDTLVLSKPAGFAEGGAPKYAAVAEATTKGAKIAFEAREDVTPQRVEAARAAWDRLHPSERKALLDARVEMDRRFDEVYLARLKAKAFDEVSKARQDSRLIGVDAARQFAYKSDTDLRAAIGTSRSESQLRQRLSGVAPNVTKALESVEPPRRFLAYAAHAVYDHLTGGPWEKATEAARSLGFDPQAMANEFTAAVQASPMQPANLRGQRFTDPGAAVKSLVPTATAEELNHIIRNAKEGITNARRDVNRVAAELRRNVFVKYFEERTRPEAPDSGIPFRDFYRSYIGSTSQKIHMEPALHRALDIAGTIPDNALRDRAKTMIRRMSNQRHFDDITSKGAKRVLNNVLGGFYQSVLPLKPVLGAANLTQFPIFGVELGTGPHAALPWEVHALARRPEFLRLMNDTGLLKDAMPYESMLRAEEAGVNVASLMQDLWNAPNAAAAAATVHDLSKKGVRAVDLLARTEPVVRGWTAAASMIKRSREMGIDKAVQSGQVIPDTVLDTLLNRMTIDIGNTNFFMGRGSNQSPIVAAVTERFPTLSRPATVFSSMPMGANGWLVRNLRDLRKGFLETNEQGAKIAPPERRQAALQAAVNLSGAAAALTAIAGPLGVVPLVDWMDEEMGGKGAFKAFFREWQRHYNLVGLLTLGAEKVTSAIKGSPHHIDQPNLYRRVGTSQIPLVSIPASIATGSFRPETALDGLLFGSLTEPIMDTFGTAAAAGARYSGGVPTEGQAEAAGRLLGMAAEPLLGVDVGSNVGPVPPDLAMMIPLMAGSNAIYNAFNAHDAEARLPGAIFDEKGRLKSIRSKTDEIMAFVGGGLLAEDIGRTRKKRTAITAARYNEAKSKMVRAMVDGKTDEATAQMAALQEIAPGIPFGSIKGIMDAVKDESERRFLTQEEAVFTRLPEPVARMRMAEAGRRLQDPSWLSASRPEDVRREQIILRLGAQRFINDLVSLPQGAPAR